MDQTSKGLSQKIKAQINSQNNQSKVQQILVKMGRLLAKKKSLHSQFPVLVYENRIWLGNYTYANNSQFLTDNNIKLVVSCLQLPLSLHLAEISYKRFVLIDEKDERFQSLLEDFYRTINQSNQNIFVHCFSGKSRSVAMLLYYIMRKEKISFSQAKNKLCSLYPLAQPNKYFQSVLISKENFFEQQLQGQSIDLLGDSIQSPTYKNSPLKSKTEQNIIDLEPQQTKPSSKEEINLLEEPTLLSQNLLQNSVQSSTKNQASIGSEKASPQFQNLIEIESVSTALQANLIDLKQGQTLQTSQNIQSQKQDQQNENTKNEDQITQKKEKSHQTNLLQMQDESQIMIENANFSQKRSKKPNKKKKK